MILIINTSSINQERTVWVGTPTHHLSNQVLFPINWIIWILCLAWVFLLGTMNAIVTVFQVNHILIRFFFFTFSVWMLDWLRVPSHSDILIVGLQVAFIKRICLVPGYMQESLLNILLIAIENFNLKSHCHWSHETWNSTEYKTSNGLVLCRNHWLGRAVSRLAPFEPFSKDFQRMPRSSNSGFEAFESNLNNTYLSLLLYFVLCQ